MRIAIWAILFGLLANFWGCASKENQRAEWQKAFLAGQQQAQQQAQAQQPSVTIRGPVKRPVVPWSEGLTLARALVLAEYYGFTDPRNILITRQGTVYQVSPRKLLNGLEDPELEAGDIIELVR
jgi:hypothetical protein